jgi:hypothetical protein
VSKYDPLEHFLGSSNASRLPMTFDEIERILGFPLPHSQTHRAWWSNNPSNNVMTKAWLAAGYETEQVDIEGRKLVFRRVGKAPVSAGESANPTAPKPSRRHPLFGWMKGTFTIAPGTDLTAPADPEWADIAWGPEKKDDSGKNAA